MKILVTGANGLLGQKLVQLLAPMQEVELIATGRGPDRLPDMGLPYRYHKVDISSREEVQRLLEEELPDFVIHGAAMTQVDDCEQQRDTCRLLNVEAVEYFVRACESLGIFFLFVSTDFIFDGKEGPYRETDIPNPVNYYGACKLEAEQIVRGSLYEWAIARTVLVYGVAHDMSRSNIVLWVKNSLEQGKPISVVDDQERTPTLAEDLAMGCWLIVKHRARGIFHIGGPDALTPYQIALATATHFGLDASLISRTDSGQLRQPALRPPRTGFVLDKARQQLGYAPHTFSEGLRMLGRQLENR